MGEVKLDGAGHYELPGSGAFERSLPVALHVPKGLLSAYWDVVYGLSA